MQSKHAKFAVLPGDVLYWIWSVNTDHNIPLSGRPLPPPRKSQMFQLPEDVYDSVGVGEDAVDEVPQLRRGSTAHLNIELQRHPEGLYDTLRDERNTEYERPVCSADASQKSTSTLSCHSRPTTSTTRQFSMQSHRSLSTSNCHHWKTSTRRQFSMRSHKSLSTVNCCHHSKASTRQLESRWRYHYSFINLHEA